MILCDLYGKAFDSAVGERPTVLCIRVESEGKDQNLLTTEETKVHGGGS